MGPMKEGQVKERIVKPKSLYCDISEEKGLRVVKVPRDLVDHQLWIYTF